MRKVYGFIGFVFTCLVAVAVFAMYNQHDDNLYLKNSNDEVVIFIRKIDICNRYQTNSIERYLCVRDAVDTVKVNVEKAFAAKPKALEPVRQLQFDPIIVPAFETKKRK